MRTHCDPTAIRGGNESNVPARGNDPVPKFKYASISGGNESDVPARGTNPYLKDLEDRSPFRLGCERCGGNEPVPTSGNDPGPKPSTARSKGLGSENR